MGPHKNNLDSPQEKPFFSYNENVTVNNREKGAIFRQRFIVSWVFPFLFISSVGGETLKKR